MRKIFAEASLAAVNPGNQSAIEINMIDGAGGFTPAHMALDAPPSGEEIEDRPLLSTTAMQNVTALKASMPTSFSSTANSIRPAPNGTT